MEDTVTALLVGLDEDLFRLLKQTLEQLGMQTDAVQTCAQARVLLGRPELPELVFSGSNLPDGTWAEVVGLAAQASTPVPAIVVSPAVDYKLYIDSLEAGAADFIMAPFAVADIAYVVRHAREKALSP